MIDAIQPLLSEPRAPDPPVRVRVDWVLLAVLIPLAVIGAAVVDDTTTWRIAGLALTLALAVATLWRRSHTFLVVIAGFGAAAVIDVAASAARTGPIVSELAAPPEIALAYALGRWASGKELTAGIGAVLATGIASGLTIDDSTLEVLGSMPLWMLPIAVGITVRYRDRLRRQGIDEARAAERQQLARELHDTVAHHVSAIAVLAQAGQAVGATKPDQAIEVLGRIESAASSTLAEMRAMVGALRADDAAELAPQAGVRAIADFAHDDQAGPPTEVTLSGDLDDLAAPVATALYRIAQEAITNARRHGRHASRISVAVDRDDDWVTLLVTDDGDSPSPSRTAGSGFGLVGMKERAALLGGTFNAGPRPDRGWSVEASLPAAGPSPSTSVADNQRTTNPKATT